MQVDATDHELERLRRLGDVDELLAIQVRHLAAQVDANPGNAALWGQYRAAWSDLREAAATDDTQATAAEVMERLSAAAVGDSSPNGEA